MNGDVIAVLFVVVAFASYVNYKLLRLPPTIGLMVVALALSVLLGVAGSLNLVDFQRAVDIAEQIDFPKVLLHGMLAYLLFAGALHVDLTELKSEALPVGMLATAGVFVTTFAAAGLFWGAAKLFGFEIPFMYALVFGALIAPTDPIAVLGVMKQAKVSRTFQMHITGESLFNDGVGVAVFLAVLGLAAGEGDVNFGSAALLVVEETAGAIVLGLTLGWIVYRLLRSVDDYPVEILLTLALAGGVYALAEAIGVSAPIAVVVAGVVIGNHGRASAMSEKTRAHVDTFWELIDEILNGVLFVLIGFEVLILHVDRIEPRAAALAGAAIVAVLLARAAGVVVSAATLRRMLPRWRVAAATWAGLRGGISIALALSLPPSDYRYIIITSTYAVVIFSILVQGLTLGPLFKAAAARGQIDEEPPDAKTETRRATPG